MFWENFCELCRKTGKTPTEVVHACGIATGSVTKWKNGALPGRRSRERLSEYFGIEPHVLFEPQSARLNAVRIPVCGDVAAGPPIDALTDSDDFEEIPADMAATGEFVALRIHGNSMQPRMEDGDIVIVRIQQTVEDGQIAVVLLDEGDGSASATCKRVKIMKEGVMLLSFNPDYEPMFFSAARLRETPLRIFGRVVELRAKFDQST